MSALKSRVLIAFAVMFCTTAQAERSFDQKSSEVSLQVEQFILDQVGPMASQISASDPGFGQVSVNVTPPSPEQLGECVQFEPYLPAGRQIMPKSVIGLRCIQDGRPTNSTSAPPILIKADVSVSGATYVARVALQPNESITAEAIEGKPVNILSVQPANRVTLSQLIGRRVTQRVMPGQTIRLSSTRGAQSVKKGDIVRVEAKSGGLVVATQGEVQHPAEVGSSVSVKTPNGRVVQGVLSQDGSITVPF